MVWKIGLIIILVGMALSIGGCVSIGAAISKAGNSREVSNRSIDVGGEFQLGPVLVDASAPVRLRLTAQLEVPQEILDSAVDGAKIVNFTLPVNYKVTDHNGEPVHLGAGTLGGSEIVPQKDGPHDAGYDRVVTLSHESKRFDPPASGAIDIHVEMPDRAEQGAPVTQAGIQVFDRAPHPAGWAAAGALAVIGGPALGALGFVVWVIGLLIGRKGSPREATSSV